MKQKPLPTPKCQSRTHTIILSQRHPSKTISLRSLRRTAKQALDLLKLRGCTVEITLVGDTMMRRLNARFMEKRGTTDVLSFPQVSVNMKNVGKALFFRGQHLGDIVVSLDQANRQARAQGLTATKEVAFLIVHSLLHLIGFDHDTPRARARMQSCESKLWRKLQENKINSKF